MFMRPGLHRVEFGKGADGHATRVPLSPGLSQAVPIPSQERPSGAKASQVRRARHVVTASVVKR